jgi:hypothetical protein
MMSSGDVKLLLDVIAIWQRRELVLNLDFGFLAPSGVTSQGFGSTLPRRVHQKENPAYRDEI